MTIIKSRFKTGDTVWFADEFFPDGPGGGMVYKAFSGVISEYVVRANGVLSVRLVDVSHRPAVHAMEDECFPTEADAQAEADRLNKEDHA